MRGSILPWRSSGRLFAGNLRRQVGAITPSTGSFAKMAVSLWSVAHRCPNSADHKLAADAGVECFIRSGRRRHSEGQTLPVGRGGVLRPHSGVCRSDGARPRLVCPLTVSTCLEISPTKSTDGNPKSHKANARTKLASRILRQNRPRGLADGSASARIPASQWRL
jgi:hypothetical protein